MGNKPTDPIYSIVEKAYFRLQAGDILGRCLEAGSTDPIHEMIQDMVLAGPQNLEALREIIGEATKRKAQVYDDLNQVINQLSIILKGYGVNLGNKGGNQSLLSLSEEQLIRLLDDQEIHEDESRTGSIQVLKESQDLLATLNTKIGLLENIETYLMDWLWGMTYQQIRHGDSDPGEDSNKDELL